MFNLVYKSIASPIFQKSMIPDMLERAREFNGKNDITGCLLYYHGEFLQYLEGDETTVMDLFERIKVDHRHSQVTLLSHSNIYSRVFDTWSMGYEDFRGGNYQLEYLRLLVSSFIESPDLAMNPDPTTKSFWSTTKKLLVSKKLENASK